MHIGLEEPMDTVVNLLDLLDKEPNLKLVPTFGVAGVGKTTHLPQECTIITEAASTAGLFFGCLENQISEGFLQA